MENRYAICKACSSKTQDSFNVNSTNLDMNKSAIPYFDFEKPTPVDFTGIYEEKGSYQASSMLEDSEKCRLCLQRISGEHKSVQEVTADNIQISVPKVDFTETTDPAVCGTCLCVHDFLKNCSDVQENLTISKKELEDILTNSGIKTEEVEVKSEIPDVEMPPNFFYTDIKKEENEWKPLSYSGNDLAETETINEYNLDGQKQMGSTFQAAFTKYIHMEPESTITSESDPTYQELPGTYDSEIQVYKCTECEYETQVEYHFRRHQTKHKHPPVVQMYKCTKCPFETKQKNNLISHHLTHIDPTEVPIYACDKCEYKTRLKSSIRKHQLVHKDRSEVRMYKCDKCKFESKHKRCLIIHQQLHVDPSEVKTFKCSECDYETKHKYEFEKHQLKHGDSAQMYKCEECDYETVFKAYFMSHQLNHRDPSVVEVFRCDECDYETKEKYQLKRHQLVHKDPSEVQMYKCDKCKYETKYKTHLTTHQLRHKGPSEVQMYRCDECGYKTKYKGYLKVHQFNHKGANFETYRSEGLQNVPAQSQDLRVPLLKEEDVSEARQLNRGDSSEARMYKSSFETEHKYESEGHPLEVRGYESPRKRNVTAHEGASEVQMCKCTECAYEARDMDELKRHQYQHRNPSEVQKYKCDKCDYRTTLKRSITLHQMGHKDPS